MNNKTKQKYEEPKLGILVFDTSDIISTSGFEGDHDSLCDEENPQE